MSQPVPVTPAKRRRFVRRVLIFCAVAAFVTGCNTVGYYKQAAAGQYEILARREPIQEVLTRTNTSPALREKLQLVLDIRRFAEHELNQIESLVVQHLQTLLEAWHDYFGA